MLLLRQVAAAEIQRDGPGGGHGWGCSVNSLALDRDFLPWWKHFLVYHSGLISCASGLELCGLVKGKTEGAHPFCVDEAELRNSVALGSAPGCWERCVKHHVVLEVFLYQAAVEIQLSLLMPSCECINQNSPSSAAGFKPVCFLLKTFQC